MSKKIVSFCFVLFLFSLLCSAKNTNKKEEPNDKSIFNRFQTTLNSFYQSVFGVNSAGIVQSSRGNVDFAHASKKLDPSSDSHREQPDRKTSLLEHFVESVSYVRSIKTMRESRIDDEQRVKRVQAMYRAADKKARSVDKKVDFVNEYDVYSDMDEQSEEEEEEQLFCPFDSFSSETTLRCPSSIDCYVTQFETESNNSDLTLNSKAIEFKNNTDVSVKRITCGKYDVRLEEDYKVSKCYVHSVECENPSETSIKSCPVRVFCLEPTPTSFGRDSFDRKCSFGEIYFNGVPQPRIPGTYFYHSDGDIGIHMIPCDSSGIDASSMGSGDYFYERGNRQVPSCLLPTTGYVCKCPVGTSGANCAEYKGFQCNLKLVEPIPKCITKSDDDEDEWQLVYDRACFLTEKLEGKHTFTWHIDCKYDDGTKLKQSDLQNFTFWTSKVGGIALLKDPEVYLQATAFDFNHLSGDKNSVVEVAIKPENFEGEFINIDLSVSKNTIFGGRAYVEMKLVQKNITGHHISLVDNAPLRVILDEVSHKVYSRTVVSTGGIVGIVFGIIGLALLVLLIVFVVKKCKEKREREERERHEKAEELKQLGRTQINDGEEFRQMRRKRSMKAKEKKE